MTEVPGWVHDLVVGAIGILLAAAATWIFISIRAIARSVRSRGGRRTESEGSHALVNVTPHESAARAARLEHSAGWSVRRLATLAALLAGSIAISYFWREPVVRETVSLLLVLIAGVVARSAETSSMSNGSGTTLGRSSRCRSSRS